LGILPPFYLSLDDAALVVKNLVRTRIPTGYGDFTLYLYRDAGKEHLALVSGHVSRQRAVPVRVHSECITGDVFGSRRCDCGDQLRHTLQYLGRVNSGVLIYLRQEGRGIGLLKKMEAYNLQDEGLDTVEANLELGHQADEREYDVAAHILADLDVQSIRLITNNPHKVDSLRGLGVIVDERIPIEVGHHHDNLGYLRSKADKMAHILSFQQTSPSDEEYRFLDPLLDQLRLAKNNPVRRPFGTLIYSQDMSGAAQVLTGATLNLYQCLKDKHDAIVLDAGDFADAYGEVLVAQQRVVIDYGSQSQLTGSSLDRIGDQDIVVTGRPKDASRIRAAVPSSVRVIEVDRLGSGMIDLPQAMTALGGLGLSSLLIASPGVLAEELNLSGLLDYALIALSPKSLGPKAGLVSRCSIAIPEPQYNKLGQEVLIHGYLSV